MSLDALVARYLAADARWARLYDAVNRPTRAGYRMRLIRAVDRAFTARCHLEDALLAALPQWATTSTVDGEERTIVYMGYRWEIMAHPCATGAILCSAPVPA